ncbi:ABC transporter substrate-binding protein [Kocuria tytonis]|uniref:Iron compound ABC transporter iron compound-binding protein n=1 Tax=Kocuria tytonis TaxID=2054280 RepID=A0A495A949_9MICC|nr:ABC transporter substrate-binding protein [Kocuria tytonis]RKQ36537.1 iron compound ABC transporter iron compound-binding protein [Kocuria tytonis]
MPRDSSQPRRQLSRRTLLGSGLAVASLVGLTACSTGSRDGGGSGSTPGASASSTPSDTFPVTVKHALGSTTVEKAPERVVCVGASNTQDFVAALGVIPVGMTKIAWGGNDKGSTDWFDAKVSELGGQTPKTMDESDGINFTDIAQLSPDLIIAVNSGATKEEYQWLTKIAPVVAYPTGPWVNSWQDMQRVTAKALGRSQAGDDLVSQTEKLIRERSDELGDAKGKSFIYGDVSQSLGFYGPTDGRPRFLAELGMTLAPVVSKNISGDQFWREWPKERADELASDIFMAAAEDDAQAEKFRTDAVLKTIPAIKAGHGLFLTDKQDMLSGNCSSPLAMSRALDVHVPALKNALGA